MGYVIDKSSLFFVRYCANRARASVRAEMRERIDDAIARVTAARERERAHRAAALGASSAAMPASE
jgi:hypothetical protein